MYLALRKLPATNSLWHRFVSWLIKWRLVSQYCHGGVVVDGKMYHANWVHGLHVSDFTPSKWELYDLGTIKDEYALELFQNYKGAKYDWLGILGFVLPFKMQKSKKFYCFEWCFLACNLYKQEGLVTPETLLRSVLIPS